MVPTLASFDPEKKAGELRRRRSVPVDPEFEPLYRKVGSTVFDRNHRRHLPGFAHVTFVVVYMHGWRWLSTGPRGPEHRVHGRNRETRNSRGFPVERRPLESTDCSSGWIRNQQVAGSNPAAGSFPSRAKSRSPHGNSRQGGTGEPSRASSAFRTRARLPTQSDDEALPRTHRSRLPDPDGKRFVGEETLL